MNKKFVLRLTITVAVLAVIVTRVDVAAVDLGSPLRVAGGIGVAVALLTVNQGLTAVRWGVILGGESPGWSYLTHLSLVGIFFSTFLPTSVGGDAARAWGVAGELRDPGTAVSSVVVDRAMGFGALAVYLVAGTILSRDLTTELVSRLQWGVPLWAVVVALVAGAAATVAAVRLTRLSTWLRQAVEHLDRFRRSGGSVVRAVVLSFVVQGLYIVVWVVLARSVGFDLPLASFLFTVPVVSIGAMIPVTLSGVGIREGLWILLLARFELPAATVAAFSLLYFAAFAVTGAIGGGLYLWRGLSRERETAEGESS